MCETALHRASERVDVRYAAEVLPHKIGKRVRIEFQYRSGGRWRSAGAQAFEIRRRDASSSSPSRRASRGAGTACSHGTVATPATSRAFPNGLASRSREPRGSPRGPLPPSTGSRARPSPCSPPGRVATSGDALILSRSGSPAPTRPPAIGRARRADRSAGSGSGPPRGWPPRHRRGGRPRVVRRDG